MPSRRVILKYIAIGTVGYTFLHSCNQSGGSPGEAAKKLGLSSANELTLAALCKAILPVIPVPKDQEQPEIHQFVLKMMNDCYGPEVQKQFKEGLSLFGDKVEQETGTSPDKADLSKIQTIIKQLEGMAGKEDAIAVFYRLTKSLTIKAFTGSKYYLTQIRPYVLVPGKYQGCV